MGIYKYMTFFFVGLCMLEQVKTRARTHTHINESEHRLKGEKRGTLNLTLYICSLLIEYI